LKVDVGDFRRLYASLSDEALLEIKREDLIPVARECYNQELSQRGLKPGTAGGASAVGEEEVAGSEHLALVAECSCCEEADLARALLESAGIPVFPEPQGSVNWTGTGGVGKRRLFVAASDVEQAREILDAQVSDEELAAQAEAEAPPESGQEEGQKCQN